MQEVYSDIFGKEYAEKVALKDDGKSILVCNFRVWLTPTEYAIVALLTERGDWLTKDEISALISTDKVISSSSIAVHVANLNKKASRISGRRIVEGNREAKYRISPNA